ncbi:MAG TPA: biopolymer transporter ExbD [Chitinophagaceae bacterium]
MPKIKIARKSTLVDMTPMCDVAFLLLTFFMLTTKFKPQDPVVVVTPSSISSQLLPEASVAMITVSKDGRVFFGLDQQNMRLDLIKAINQQYQLGLTPEELKNYSLASTVGVPIHQLKSFLSVSPDKQKDYPQPGVPYDSTNNELKQWLAYTVTVNGGNQDLQFVIKADDNTKYPVVNKVLQTMKDGDHMKLHLVTSLKATPPGTPAWLSAQKAAGAKK